VNPDDGNPPPPLSKLVWTIIIASTILILLGCYFMYRISLVRAQLRNFTPVLRYSEGPDRMSEDPALRSTSEPA